MLWTFRRSTRAVNFKSAFKGLFRTSDDWKNRPKARQLRPAHAVDGEVEA